MAIEASYRWHPVHGWLKDEGHEVKLAARSRPGDSRSEDKDRRQGFGSAGSPTEDGLVTDFLYSVERIRELRDLVRLRTYLVRERVWFKNKIRAGADEKMDQSSASIHQAR